MTHDENPQEPASELRARHSRSERGLPTPWRPRLAPGPLEQRFMREVEEEIARQDRDNHEGLDKTLDDV